MKDLAAGERLGRKFTCAPFIPHGRGLRYINSFIESHCKNVTECSLGFHRSANMNSYIGMDRILLYFLGNIIISIDSPMVWIVSYKSPLLKFDMQLSLSDLNGPKYNVGCLPIAILLTLFNPTNSNWKCLFYIRVHVHCKTRAESLKSDK